MKTGVFRFPVEIVSSAGVTVVIFVSEAAQTFSIAFFTPANRVSVEASRTVSSHTFIKLRSEFTACSTFQTVGVSRSITSNTAGVAVYYKSALTDTVIANFNLVVITSDSAGLVLRTVKELFSNLSYTVVTGARSTVLLKSTLYLLAPSSLRIVNTLLLCYYTGSHLRSPCEPDSLYRRGLNQAQLTR